MMAVEIESNIITSTFDVRSKNVCGQYVDNILQNSISAQKVSLVFTHDNVAVEE